MRPLLALDTATERPSLAVGLAGAAAHDAVVADRGELSREIERVVARLLDSHGLRASDLGGVLLADGPGSFTGLRIGAAFAKGVVRALGVPLLVAPSLLGAARAAVASVGTVVAEYDALRGDVYRAVYRFGQDDVAVLRAPGLARRGEPVDPAAVRAGPQHASAAALLASSVLRGAVNRVEDPAGWQPDYGRPAEAEARRLRHGGP